MTVTQTTLFKEKPDKLQNMIIKLKDVNNTFLLGGDYQTYQFGLIDKNNVFVGYGLNGCKDYIQDYVWANKVNSTLSFNNNYCFTKQPINLKPLMIFVSCNMKNFIVNSLKFINVWERRLKISPTVLIQTDTPNVYGLKVSKKWHEQPQALSLYTLLFRAGWNYVDAHENVIQHLNKIPYSKHLNDASSQSNLKYYSKYVLENIKWIYDNPLNKFKHFDKNWIDFKNNSHSHNNGFCNMNKRFIMNEVL